MKQYKNRRLLVLTFITVLFAGCSKDIIEPASTVSDSFECGSIGEISKVSDTEYELSLADDNDNPELPDNWRSWWYVTMENLSIDTPIKITITNSGWPFYYLPVYSYDQIDWVQFTEEEVSQNEKNELIISKKYSQQKVWIARFYPYTYSDLRNYLDAIKGSRFINILAPGNSQEGNPIYLIKITDSAIPNTHKKRIFIHARTHPAEIPSSFLIEGMINFLLSGTAEALEVLSRFEFYIFPMQNVDGVIAGNYRTTPKSENLEMMWYNNSIYPLKATTDAPPEVTIIQQYAFNLMNDGGPAVSVALNLHASNSEPDIRPFFYPHFGTESQGYTSVEASLWGRQLSFINHVANHFGYEMIEPLPEEGGSSFAGKTFPESWWWVNYADAVMALTIEMTYGRAGYSPRWINRDDLRNFGASLVLGIRDYSDETVVPALSTQKAKRDIRNMNLKYPELYPPAARDELKE